MADLITICYTSVDTRKRSKPYTVLRSNVSVTLKHPTSLLDPVFILHRGDLDDRVNYVIWRGRQFFCKPPTFVDGGLVELTCHEDVLTTFWPQIRNVNTLILRQENVWNPFIKDDQLPVRTERKVSIKKIGKLSSGNLSNNLILTVTGGKIDNV